MDVQYRDIITAFKTFFDAHMGVQSVIDAQVYNFQANEESYPAVVIVPNVSNGTIGSVQVNFSIFFCDVLIADGSNTRDVYSDTLEVAKDFVSYFTNPTDLEWSLMEDFSLTPFEEKFDDIVGGWQLDCSVEIPFRHSICDIPFKN